MTLLPVTPNPARPDLDDIQGNILRGYRCEATTYLFWTICDQEAAREWLHDLAASVTTADAAPSGVALNIGFSCTGLAVLGVPQRALAQLSPAFRQGMAGRARMLGDPVTLDPAEGREVPSDWHAPFGTDRDLHLVLMVSGPAADVDERVAELRCQAWQFGLRELDGSVQGRRLPGGKEHFGFVDGLSNPQVPECAPRTSRRPADPVPAGEFVLGLPGRDGTRMRQAQGLTRNGSYLVIRKLEQNVPAFESMVDRACQRTGLDPEVVRAKLMGRWRDGTPLTRDGHPGLAPGWSSPADRPASPGGAVTTSTDPAAVAFDFADDPGTFCPVGSHVRRANPRGSLNFEGRLEQRHRIMRRGIPYGSPAQDGSGRGDQDRPGLLFACYQASIESQFEFVQTQWLMDGNVFALGTSRDPVLSPGTSPMHVQLPSVDAEPTQGWLDAGACVTSRGGEYFLVPGIAALRSIARVADLYRTHLSAI
ncbi:MAG: Dyp-type peroxidase [Actinomycetales bacterium]